MSHSGYVMFPTEEKVPNEGSYSSALKPKPVGCVLMPPVINTFPSGSSVAV